MELYEFLGILVVLAGVGVLAWFINRMTYNGKPVGAVISDETNANKEIENKETGNMEKKWKSREFFLSTLKEIDCTYETDEKDRIGFTWQGGNFVADVSDDCPFAVVWYLGWGEYELYDVDNLSRVRTVINDANINYNMNVIYSIDKEGGIYYLHTKKHFLFIPSIEDAADYLKSILGEFYIVRRYVETELERKRIEEEKLER